MREYGQIQCAFWGHPKVEGLGDQAKLLACYILTGPHSNGLGCYRLPEGYVMADLGWSKETVSKAFQSLCESGLIARCDTTKWLIVPDYLEWNGISNPKVGTARIKEAREVPRGCDVWPAMVAALCEHGKHLPEDFEKSLKEDWLPIAARVPKKNRDEVMARDGHKCLECGAEDDLTIDHIKPISFGGTHHKENLQTLCRPCNSSRFPNGMESLSEWLANGFDTVSKQEPTQPNPERKEPLSGKPDPCDEIFKHWQTVMGHTRAKFDKKRKGKVKDRLADGYTAEDLMQAIDGCKRSPHHMGDNDHGTVYDGLELICRDAEHVDRFIAIAEGRGLKGKGQPEPNPPSRRALN